MGNGGAQVQLSLSNIHIIVRYDGGAQVQLAKLTLMICTNFNLVELDILDVNKRYVALN